MTAKKSLLTASQRKVPQQALLFILFHFFSPEVHCLYPEILIDH